MGSQPLGNQSVDDLLDSARRGEARAIGKLISRLEDGRGEEVLGASRSSAPRSSRGWVTGITGAPGAGKSTLADGLIAAWRDRGRTVAVLAVDPSSPFTGGALLGDRIRMNHAADPGVLVRSMATRGQLGGLAATTTMVASLCADLGFDEILVETVGVGQSELDVATAADTTVVVLTPGWGDSVQAAKAGIMEVGDIFVVNKADREGAAATQREVTEMLRLAEPDSRVPVLATVATTGSGLDDLIEAIEAHRELLNSDSVGGRSSRLVREFEAAVARSAADAISKALGGDTAAALREEVATGDIDPWAAATTLVRDVLRGPEDGSR